MNLGKLFPCVSDEPGSIKPANMLLPAQSKVPHKHRQWLHDRSFFNEGTRWAIDEAREKAEQIRIGTLPDMGGAEMLDAFANVLEHAAQLAMRADLAERGL